mmetsp:Transcript_30275/g.73813  ORF Transcript_30275/g.73813 Transcript_30275/m.73813 type:complete len:216 (-) Transcript_30275:135-782(-)|eukprot:CAMPEP_0198318820 /NCGR_PEP_ID=MMETSP1450-20131203/8092_1 /TAXON_ID=753684 ORGANISM="Madagascaria erythrocladiodes, Strain CCMP3234" /NCGR_SAMPLE_ID=MMETSP1450 /ASSEMBLY_ACC=CAM_ASM_001115 /LENGTH=215 /DNA_ID=CAMNT_0044022159 /DNA_START=128 /DNA_END=775 /DNA_ORIENTATION=-
MNAFVNGAVLGTSSFVARAHVAKAPAPVRSAKTITMIKSESMPFMEAPAALDGSAPGDVGFDPLGFSTWFDIKWLQEAEIKHGRICMLACLGFFVQEFFKLPFDYFPTALPVDAHDIMIKRGGMAQILLWIHAFEIISIPALIETMQGKRAPGDFAFDPLGLGKNPGAFKKYQLAEIKNGRLAMIGIGGMIHAQWIYKQGIIDQLTHMKPMTLSL